MFLRRTILILIRFLVLLRMFSLKINSGDKLGIIGKNGAGEKYFVENYMQIYSPDKGVVKTEGSIALF